MLEASRLYAFLRLDGKVDLIDGTQYLIDFAYRGLVLKVDGGVEVGYFGVDAGAHHFAFSCMEKSAKLYSTLVYTSIRIVLLHVPNTVAGGP